MYDTHRQTRKFNTDTPGDMEEYDGILNDPTCSIIESRKEKLRNEIYEDGEIVRATEHIILVVTWEQKRLL